LAIDTIAPDHDGDGLRIGIVQARFNEWAGRELLQACLQELEKLGVDEGDITHLTVPGALEIPLVLARMAGTGEYDALVALGCVIRGETYHFEIVAGESAAGIARVALDAGVPVANGVLTTDNDAQARARVAEKGRDAARVAVEMANLVWALEESGEEAAAEPDETAIDAAAR
jgi:6,7-dimethyl-8-ribityllumazine synthase